MVELKLPSIMSAVPLESGWRGVPFTDRSAPPRRRWRRWLGFTVIAAALPGLTAVWLLFQYIPAWYRPLAIAGADNLQSIRDDLVRQFGAFDRFNETPVQAAGPFEYHLRQEQINAWLAAREEIWPRCRRWLPCGLSDPFIAIGDNYVLLAATYRRGDLKTVLNARLALRVRDGGVGVQLQEVRAGQLRIPRAWITRRLAALDAGPWPAGQRSPLQYEARKLPPLSQLFQGVVFPGAWVWQNGDKPFRISALSCQNRMLTVTLEPLPP